MQVNGRFSICITILVAYLERISGLLGVVIVNVRGLLVSGKLDVVITAMWGSVVSG